MEGREGVCALEAWTKLPFFIQFFLRMCFFSKGEQRRKGQLILSSLPSFIKEATEAGSSC